jgi:hypothetical protein
MLLMGRVYMVLLLCCGVYIMPGIEGNAPIIDNTGCCYDHIRDIKIYSCVLSEDGDYISGYTEDGTKAKYIYKDKKWYYGSEISKLNLITFDKISKEEHKKIASLGGKHTQENNRNKRTLNDIAKAMLEIDVSETNIDEILGTSKELIGDDRSAGAVMIAKMIQQACAGSFKAAEFVRDTAGYKIDRQQIELQADIMTDADRSLLDKINQRIG